MVTPVYKDMKSEDGYYLILSNIRFSKGEENGFYSVNNGMAATTGMQMTSTYVETALWIHADYAIYDGSNKKKVAYGSKERKSRFAYAMTRSDWEKCVLHLTKHIIAKTPIMK